MRKVWVITFSVILLLFLGLLIFNLFDGLSRISLSTPTQNLALSPTPISIFTPTIALTPAPTASAIPTPSANELVPSLIQISDYSGAWDKLKESFSSGLIKTTVSPVKVEFWLGWNILKNTVGEIIFPLLSALIVILIIILLVFRLLTSGKYYQMVIDDFKYGSVHYENEEVGTSISGKVRESLFRYYSGEKEGLPATIDQPSMNKDENRFKLIDKPIFPSDLIPSTVPSQITSIVDFLLKLFPLRILHISGKLEFHQEYGVGLSITFDDNDNKHIARYMTFWEKDLDLLKENSDTKINTASNKPSTQGSILVNFPTRKFTISFPAEIKIAENKTNSDTKKTPDADTYYMRCRVLVDVVSAWIYWNICDTTNKRSQQKSILGTDSFISYQWFVLFLNFYIRYFKDKVDKDLETAKKYLIKSIQCDQHNSLANLNYALRFSLLENNENQSKDVQQEIDKIKEYVKLMEQAIENSEKNDLAYVRANYFLGNQYFELLLNGRRRKNILLESDLEEKIKYHSFLNYFKNAAVESKKCTSLTTNAKLAFQIPYLASSLAMGKINGWNACTELFKKERQKNKISIFQANENNADLYYNLACFYSMVSHIDNFSEYTLPILRRFFYQRDDKLIIKYPTNYSEIALRNIEKAFDCDYRIAPNIINDPCFEALQVDYASEFEKIKTKHSKILLEPQNDKKDTANIEVGGHQDTTLSLSPLALNIALGLNKEPLETILEVIEKENESQSENEDFNKKAEYFFELASFYSLISCSMAIKKPNQFADLGLRSLEIALQCNPKRILALVDLDAWLDNIRENNRGEYDAIIQKYSILDNTIHPKDKKSAKKSDES